MHVEEFLEENNSSLINNLDSADFARFNIMDKIHEQLMSETFSVLYSWTSVRYFIRRIINY
jgi:hypothetical protein